MRFSFITLLTTTAWLSTANASYQRVDEGMQQVINNRPITLTKTTTRTRYMFDIVTETMTRTRAVVGSPLQFTRPTMDSTRTDAVVGPPLQFTRKFVTSTRTRTVTETPSVQPVETTPAVQTWYRGQEKEGCDRTACASCKWYYKCQGSEPDCFRCDTAPYCEGCEQALSDSTEHAFTGTVKTEITSMIEKTCTNASGETVACVVVEGNDIYTFDVDEVSAVDQEGPLSRKTCSLGPGRTVPCDTYAESGSDLGEEANVVQPEEASSSRRICSIGPGQTVPCGHYANGDAFVWHDES